MAQFLGSSGTEQQQQKSQPLLGITINSFLSHVPPAPSPKPRRPLAGGLGEPTGPFR